MKTVKDYFRTAACLFTVIFLFTFPLKSKADTTLYGQKTDTPKCIGQSEKSFELGQSGVNISGMSFIENTAGNYLYILDRNAKQILRYSVNPDADSLIFKDVLKINKARLTSPRGLAYSKEESSDVFYFVDYLKTKDRVVSRLYRYNASGKDLTFIDLTDKAYDIGNKEIYGLTVQDGNLFISFDPSEYSDQVTRIRRGILKISVGGNKDLSSQIKKQGSKPLSDWGKALAGHPVIIKHLPGPGKTTEGDQVESSLALAGMSVEGANYLWGTVGAENIYLLDSESGRGIFFFEIPGSNDSEVIYHSGVAFGAGHLWVAEPNTENAVVHRINVLENKDLPYEGPKRFREVRMRLVSVVKDSVKTPRGFVYHTFLHPFPTNVLGRQGVIPNSVKVNDLNNTADCNIEHLFYNPAGDPASRQDYTLATYSTELNPDIREYLTDFSIKVWMRKYQQFIYPHLVNKDSGPVGTSYLNDDEVLYRIKSNPEIYPAFIQRVKNYIISEYGIDPKMDNPYWAARNIEEYVRENYHYPKDEKGFYATYDFEKGNYNSNPGNLKAELSADGKFEDNIIACSGTGAMVCGALRSIGIPATWMGVSQEQGWKQWGTEDRDEFLEFNEESTVTNGHRYNHVWLGELYKWQRFDATPATPNGVEFDKKPAEVSQWDFMLKSAAGVEPHRVVHTIQSEFWAKLHHPFVDCEEDVNSCGATRYNLLGSYTFPQDFKLSKNIIRYRAIQFVDDIRIDMDEDLSGKVSWQLIGEWELDPDARLEVILEKKVDQSQEKNTSGYEKFKVLTRDIPIMKTSVNVDLKELEPGRYRVKVIKAGDPATGNAKSFVIQ